MDILRLYPHQMYIFFYNLRYLSVYFKLFLCILATNSFQLPTDESLGDRARHLRVWEPLAGHQLLQQVHEEPLAGHQLLQQVHEEPLAGHQLIQQVLEEPFAGHKLLQ